MAPHIKGLLTAEQRRKLPASVVNQLDTRYWDLVRNGTGMYAGAGGGMGPDMMMMGGSMMMVESMAGSTFTIIR